MKLIDTHCHLYLEEFDADREHLVSAAKDSRIERILMPNVDSTTTERLFDLCDRHPEFACPMMGLHPTSVGSNYAGELGKTESLLAARTYCAIGEIGIDLYWDKTFLQEQKEVFEEQLRWSIGLKLPVAIHTREAFGEVLDSIHKVGADKLTGVFHSFSGTAEDLEEIKKLTGFKLGINGVVTYKNSKLADVISLATIEDIVLETDAPYLPPVPFRGKRNEPVYIWETAKKVAGIYGLTVGRTVEITRENALKVFKNVNFTDM